MSRYFADLTVRDENGRPLALVEVKGDLASNREYASQLRRNILAHTRAADVPYFLVLTPSVGYLWKYNPPLDAANSLIRPPDSEFSASEILNDYVPGEGEDTGQASSVLELIFYQWLSDLANGANGWGPGQVQGPRRHWVLGGATRRTGTFRGHT